MQGSRLEVREGGVALEGLGERHAALGAELVVAEPAHTAKEGEKEQVQRACMLWGLKVWVGGFDGRAADSSHSRVVLLLRASASAMPPLGPSSLSPSLRSHGKGRVRRSECS